MLYTQKSLSTLEYDKVIDMLASRALTSGARARALSLLPSADYDTVCLRQRHTADARRLLARKGFPPFAGVSDILGSIERAEKGAILSARELLDIAATLTCARALVDYESGNGGEEKNSLTETFARLCPNRTLESRITRAIPSPEVIADEASTALADIRRKMRVASNRIKDTLQKFLSGNYARFLQENLVTTRDGRYVIPVKAEYRNEIKGLVHDVSSSGATLFVEPMAVVEANNELRVLEGKEQKEIERILAELSALCADYADAITTNYHSITDLAFFFTCASLAEEMRAEQPVILQTPEISLVRARHPLLDKNKVVPINVALGGDIHTVVITGPNTGGKTVTLKTLGLFALMAQAGLHLPADERTRIGVFSEVLVDIGDEQSIEQSLSTFSSHMVNIVSILQSLSPSSLVLFDELGAGTDPVEGAALAGAILETTRASGALTAATTHYAELKAYALETEGVVNASCEFDVKTLRPTYRLIVGTPGKSNAFAISAKLGLSSAIIEEAKRRLSGSSKRFEGVITKLERSRTSMERDREEAERMRREYEKFKQEAERDLREKIAAAEKELEKAKDKARQIVESARATSDFVMKQLEEEKKKQTKRGYVGDLSEAKRGIRARLQEISDEIYTVESPFVEDEDYVLPRPLRVGDRVFLVGIGQEGVVTDLSDKADVVSVRAGILTAKMPIAKLRLLEGASTPKKKDPPTGTKRKMPERREQTAVREFHQEIDVRGMNGVDAWEAVDKFLDEALLAGLSSVRIIHGKGTGALRASLQNDLRHDPRVRAYRNGAYGEGDHGVTVVDLK